jgi:hypothetical protein
MRGKMKPDTFGNLLADEFWCHCNVTMHGEDEASKHVKKTGHVTMRRMMIQKVRFYPKQKGVNKK